MEWTLISGHGPKHAYSSGAAIGTKLFIHGGIGEARSTVALNNLHFFDAEKLTWIDLTSADCPCLSHHCCVGVNDRHLLFVGGWTGRVRSSEVYLYDISSNRWTQCSTDGFPSGAGLSSFSATPLRDGATLIIAREGGLRTQRRSGSAYLLSGDASKGKLTYREHPLGSASRSGHTTTPVIRPKPFLVTIGGREDNLVQTVSEVLLPAETPLAEWLEPRFESVGLKELRKAPAGRKHHVALPTGHGILVHGGETFDGKSKEPVPHLYYLDASRGLRWFEVPCQSPLPRQGHLAFIVNNQVLLHGGVGRANQVVGDTVLLS